MSSDEEWSSIFDIETGASQDVVQVLSRARLFDTLTEGQLLKLAPILHHRDFFPREVVVRQDAPGAGLYIILSGSVDVILRDTRNEDIVLATFGEGRMFGEISLVDGSPRTATVVSTTRSHLMGFFKADLMDLIEHAPRLGFKILHRLVQLLQEKFTQSLADFRSQERLIRHRGRASGSKVEAHKGNGSFSQEPAAQRQGPARQGQATR